MQFQLNDDQQMLRDMVRQFVEKEARPSAAQRDEEAIWPERLRSMSCPRRSMNTEPASAINSRLSSSLWIFNSSAA